MPPRYTYLASALAAMAFLIATARGGDPSAPEPADYNAKVAAFARSKLGEQVGDGVYSTFVQEALRDAGARVLLAPAEDGEYVWGEPLKSVKDARPGDVIQFEKVTFRGKRRGVGPNGNPTLFLATTTFPHHSAIVAKVGPKARTITILHQNASGPDGRPVKLVTEATLVMADRIQGGSLKIYRPVAGE